MANPYPFHKIALAPLLPHATEDELKKSAASGIALGEDDFGPFLLQQGLAPLWDERIDKCTNPPPFSAEFRSSLHRARLHGTGQYLIQRHSLARVKEILDEAGVIHVVTKGAHTRELYYDTPSLRPAVDIDVLVPPEDKIESIEAFQAQGFEFYGVPENISHEACLVKGKTTIDLHWDILRPGRTRMPMTNTLLEARQDFGSHWGMSDEGSLFMMLVHPVFTKYTTTPHATLVRLLDLVYLLDKREIDWPQLISWLEQAGVKTCAWITLTWLEMLTGITPTEEVMRTLRSRVTRSRYLHYWLKNDLATRWLEKPLRVQIGFTLAAHDSWLDIRRTLAHQRRATGDGKKTLEKIKRAL